jgi:thioredoxin 1
MHWNRSISVAFVVFLILETAAIALGQSQTKTNQPKGVAEAPKTGITFIELGSVKCIPCRQMQPVMASIEKKYGEQVKVVFYDVWKPETQHYAKTYGISVIPTQVFLDKEGKETFRHEGFFPEAQIDSLLKKHGLKILTPG